MNTPFSRLSVNTLTTSEMLATNGGTPFLMDDFFLPELAEATSGKKSSPSIFYPLPVEQYPTILPIPKGIMDPSIW